jgi:trk system potassium uptake protein TrkH
VTFYWYAVAVVAGSLLLSQPFCRVPAAAPLSVSDAVFTSTSAVCVTGLTVRSTGEDLSLAGQIVVLVLIQLGGIGIMTVTTFLTLMLGARQNLTRRTLLAETLGTASEPDLRDVLVRVIRLTLFFELGGAILLAGRFLFDQPPAAALWHGLFHSVSAFCNAGFSLFDDSLLRYQSDPLVNLTIMALVIGGGLGYPVLIDISRNWHGPWGKRWERYMLHTKIMLIGTVSMLVLGTVSVLLLEWQDALAGLGIGRRLLISLFHSVTCRTAGFNTVEVAELTNATLLVSMLLMVVGAGPCSTGGGFKVSTLAVLVLRARATFFGYPRVNVGKRTLPRQVTDRAITTALLFAVVAVVALTGLLMLEQSDAPHSQVGPQGLFLDATFEVISALGTVGLSVGMTPDLTLMGRAIIIVLMFVGRLGPITVFVALSREPRSQAIEYASEELLIG